MFVWFGPSPTEPFNSGAPALDRRPFSLAADAGTLRGRVYFSAFVRAPRRKSVEKDGTNSGQSRLPKQDSHSKYLLNTYCPIGSCLSVFFRKWRGSNSKFFRNEYLTRSLLNDYIIIFVQRVRSTVVCPYHRRTSSSLDRLIKFSADLTLRDSSGLRVCASLWD